MKRPILKVGSILLTGACLLLTQVVAADSIELKSGGRHHDVLVQEVPGGYLVRFENGRTLSVTSANVRKIVLAPRTWKRAIVHKNVRSVRTQGVGAQAAQPTSGNESLKPKAKQAAGSPIAKTTDRPGHARSDTAKNDSQGQFLDGAVWRSLLLPGWGQWYQGKDQKAVLFFGASTVLLYGYWSERGAFLAAQEKHNDPLPMSAVALAAPGATGLGVAYLYLEDRKAETRQHARRGNQLLVLLAGAWAWNVADVALPRSLGTTTLRAGFDFNAHPRHRTVGLRLALFF